MRRDDFATAWIHHRRSHRVLAAAGGPANDVVADIFRVPVGILGFRRCVLDHDGVAEAGLRERHVPGFDGLLEIRPPLVRHFAAQIEHDRLLGRRQERRRVFLLETVAIDETAADLAVFGRAVVVEIIGEVTHALVEVAGMHRRFGQQQDAGVKHEPQVAQGFVFLVGGAAAFGGVGRPGLVEAEFDVARECLDVLDVGAFRIDGAHAEMRLEVGGEAFRYVGGEQAGDVDDRRAVLAFVLGIEGLDHAIERRRLDPALEVGHVAGPHLVADGFQIDLVAAAHPAHHPAVHHRARRDEIAAGGQRGELGVEEHVALEHVERNLEKHVIADDDDREQARQRGHLLWHVGPAGRDVACLHGVCRARAQQQGTDECGGQKTKQWREREAGHGDSFETGICNATWYRRR